MRRGLHRLPQRHAIATEHRRPTIIRLARFALRRRPAACPLGWRRPRLAEGHAVATEHLRLAVTLRPRLCAAARAVDLRWPALLQQVTLAV